MASPAMNEYFSELASKHRELAATTVGAVRSQHRDKVDQYERLAGKRDLFRKSA